MSQLGAKLSIYLDTESTMLLTAVSPRFKNTSNAIQEIIKEWASDRGIKVRLVIEGLEDA